MTECESTKERIAEKEEAFVVCLACDRSWIGFGDTYDQALQEAKQMKNEDDCKCTERF